MASLDLDELFERFMELIVGSLEEEITSVGDVPAVDKMPLQEEAHGIDPLHVIFAPDGRCGCI